MRNDWMKAPPMALGVAAGLALLGAWGDGGASDGLPFVETAAAAESVREPVGPECEEKLADLDRRMEKGLDMGEAEAAAFRQMRDTAARFCAQGQTELAIPLLDGLLQRLEVDDNEPGDGPVDESTDESAGGDLTALTAEYLQGRWCAVSSTGETGPYVFHADGSYEVGIRAGDDYSMRPGGADLDAFRRVFHRLELKEPDRFVIYRHSYRNEFTRGSCPGEVDSR